VDRRENGVIVEVVGITDGLAELDLDGDGQANDAADLEALDITDDELAEVAELYEVGDQLWRVPVPHFSAWDCNWPFGPPAGASPPTPPRPWWDLGGDCDAEGSIIRCLRQSLGESAGIVGTDQALHYDSARVPGHLEAYSVDIPLTGADPHPELIRVILEVSIDGHRFEESFDAAPNLSHRITWDGTDVYGREVRGPRTAVIRVGHEYNGEYREPGPGPISFGQFGGQPITGNRTRQTVTLWAEWADRVGVLDVRESVVGGWSFTDHHAYTPTDGVLHRGDGTHRTAEAVGPVIDRVAGDGTGCPADSDCGDGGPAMEAQLGDARAVAVGPDGSVYIGDYQRHTIRRVDPDGTIHLFAGTGEQGVSGDGDPALEAEISRPRYLHVGDDGSVYLVEEHEYRVRRISPDGIIDTIAGTGTNAYSGDGGPARDAELGYVGGVTTTPDGTVYVTDNGNNRVRRIDAAGTITTVAGNGAYCGSLNFPCGDDGPALEAPLGFRNASGIVVASDGSIFITEDNNHRVRRIDPAGTIHPYAGTGNHCSHTGDMAPGCGDGLQATSADLYWPRDLALDSDDTLYILESYSGAISSQQVARVRRVAPDGILTRVVSQSSQRARTGDGGPSLRATTSAWVIDLGPDDRLHLADHRVVRRVGSMLPRFDARDSFVASEDGEEVYLFSPEGRHTQTVNAYTGTVTRTFDYDESGRLVAMIDGDGEAVTVERDTQGRPTAIVAPYGQRTELTTGPQGFLAAITDPAGATSTYTVTSGGLLTERTDARGATSSYTYDERGLLVSAEDGKGAVTTLARTEREHGFDVTLTTPEGSATTYGLTRRDDGDLELATTFPDGGVHTGVLGQDHGQVTVLADGTQDVIEVGPDPRFGMQTPIPERREITTPDGRTFVQEVSRSTSVTGDDPLALASLSDTTTIDGVTSTRTYDGASRTFTETTAEGRTTTESIDAQGRIASWQVGDLATTTFTYDDRGRLEQIVESDGETDRVTQVAYGPSGTMTSLTDALGRTFALGHDAAGRLISLTDPDGAEVTAEHDTGGALASLTPPGQPSHVLVNDVLGRIESYAPPEVDGEATPITFTYDAERRPTSAAFADGGVIAYGYGADGNLSTQTTTAGTVTFGYDDAGQPVQVAGSDVVDLDLDWDGQQLTSQVWSGGVAGEVALERDARGRLVGLTVDDEDTVAITVDDDGLVTAVGPLEVSRSGSHGLVTGVELGTLSESWGYDGFGDRVTQDVAVAGDAVLSLSATHDDLGRITEVVESVEGDEPSTITYDYDDAGRLIEVVRDGDVEATYAWDANGNRTAVTDTRGTASATYDDQDRVLAHGDATYVFTDAGHLATRVEDGETTAYTYDELGDLQAVVLPDGTEIGYEHDGLGRRVGRTVDGELVAGYLYGEGHQIVAELDADGEVISRFAYGTLDHVPDLMLRGDDTYRLVSDHLGSVRLVVDIDTGEVAQRLDYDAFGRVLHDSAPGFQPFGFAGGHTDPDTGLVRFGARDYDPVVGRWTSKDPVGFAAGSPNLYRYADGDPVNRIDPTGLFVSPGDPGRKIGDRGCSIICGRQRDLCEQLGGMFPSLADGSSYEQCFEDCSGRIDDLISDIENVFGLADGLKNLYDNRKLLRRGGDWLIGRF
jgi:RHS repeat-associated protein